MNGFLSGLLSAGCEGGFNWYGFLIGSGMVICIVIAYFMSVKRGYDKDLVFDICIICIPLAIVGARLYYVLFDIIGNGNKWTFKEILGIGSGGLAGLAIYGGLIGAVVGGIIVHLLKRNKPPEKKATFWQMADLAFTVIILGQAIGRWGNFANQEAFGNPVTNPSLQWFPYAVHITDNPGYASGWYQATFFYESICNAIGFALLMWLYNGKRKSFDGFSLCVYCIYYGIVRFFIEGLRSDALYLIPDVLRVSQLLSALLAIAGAAGILIHIYRAKSQGKKPFLLVDKDKLSDEYLGYRESILSHPNVYVKDENKKGFFARLFAKTEPTPELDEATDKGEDKENAGAAENAEENAVSETEEQTQENGADEAEDIVTAADEEDDKTDSNVRYADYDERDPFDVFGAAPENEDQEK
ncbi:MAG: prolipoprotein diacylglyceryl transferase [Clostridiales bacterium]|nr:prolipoprotein diacylglyceryl transferase [Clostridiales bacterium]